MSGGAKGRRLLRVASVIQEIVSRELVTGLSDPRLTMVTVTGVDISPDLRIADVRVSIMGEPKQQEDCFRAIRRAHGRLQEKVAEAVTVRYIPSLRFHVDESVKRSVALGALIAKARAEDEANRADRIRRGVEPPTELPELEESPPGPLAPAEPGWPDAARRGTVREVSDESPDDQPRAGESKE